MTGREAEDGVGEGEGEEVEGEGEQYWLVHLQLHLRPVTEEEKSASTYVCISITHSRPKHHIWFTGPLTRWNYPFGELLARDTTKKWHIL